MSEQAAQRVTGGDVLVQLMKERGIDTAFGIISVHNLPLVEAIARDLNFVEMRHEAACVSAADGYARATGGIGVAITSTGTGAGNAAGSMVEALTAGSRVLHITGQVDSEFLERPRGVIHEFPAQLDMLRATSKHAVRIERAEECRARLGEALDAIGTAPAGPASVEWPSDLQYLATPAEQLDQPARESAPPEPTGEQVAAAADLLRQARRPILWVGGGAAGASAEVTELAHRLGAAVFTSNSGRAIVSEADDLVVGNFAANPHAGELLADADLMVSLGSHFRSNETKSYHLSLPQTHVQIDIAAEALGRVYPCTVGLQGDARAVLVKLLEQVDRSATDADWPARVRATRELVRSKLHESIGGYSEICAALNAMPSGSIIARDVTIPSSQWGNRLLEFQERRQNIFPLGGGIGQGLGMAIGAAVGRPDVPTIAFVGDGGLAVHLGELGSLVQSRARCVVLVFNDQGYGVLRNMQRANGFDEVACDLATPDFEQLAGSFGIPFWRFPTAESFTSILSAALAVSGPAMIEVSVNDLSPAPIEFTPPVHVPVRTEG